MEHQYVNPYMLMRNGGAPTIASPAPSLAQHPHPAVDHGDSSSRPNGVYMGTRAARRRYRAPTIDEALPFSPLTSIIPFSPDILPFPIAAPSSKPLVFASKESHANSKKALQSLNAEASNRRTSQRLEKSLQKLHNLLRPENLTQHTFAGPQTRRRSAQLAANGVTQPSLPNLSPFAKMVTDTTRFQYRYPTPTSPPDPKSKFKDRPVKSSRPSQAGVPAAVPRPRSGNKASVQSSTASQGLNGHPPSSIQNGTEMQNAVKFEDPPQTIDPTAIQYIQPDMLTLDSNDQQSRKRKRDADDVVQLSYDRNDKADAAFQTLQNLLDEVFQAEDSYQPDTSTMYAADLSNYFQQDPNGTSDRPILIRAVQTRLDTAISRTVSTGCFISVSADDLARLQKLLDAPVVCVESLTLSVDDSPSDLDLEEWTQRLELAETGLHAAKVLLRIMTAGREEKQLYSEDLLEAVLRTLEHVIDMLIIPIVESRHSGSSTAIFQVYSSQRKQLTTLLQMCGKVLRLLGELIAKVDVSESAITKVEYLSTKLIFVENAPNEKDSALGVQRFESMRRAAMDALAKIFARHPNQRHFIFDEILVSLEKLPVTRQSARQFKLADGKPIQLVSALLIRLVQTSATWSEHDVPKTQRRRAKRDEDEEESEEESEEDEEDAPPQKRIISLIDMDKAESYSVSRAAGELRKISRQLYDNAYGNANHVIKFMIHRALNSTKSGDLPYRNLLDIFTEDFLSVLGSPEWPAAELLLQILLSHMIAIMDDDKRPVPHKNLALDLMGLMGSGISDLQIMVKNSSRGLDSDDSDLSTLLHEIGRDYQDEAFDETCIFKSTGPYRMVIEYLLSQGVEDAQTSSARGYFLTVWAKSCLSLANKDEENPNLSPSLLLQLRNTILDHSWLDNEYEFPVVSQVQCRMASALVALRSTFCKYQHLILKNLLDSMSSPHSTLKSKSLKAVPQLLEKDPSILERSKVVIQYIIRCSEDSSALVRDSALILLAKCLVLKPSLESQAYVRVAILSEDENMQVRKRAMRILKDIYLRNDNQEVRTVISASLLKRVKDHDEGIRDLARQLFEELWIAPYHDSETSTKDSVQSNLALQKQVILIVKTLHLSETSLQVLERLVQSILARDQKNASANSKVCKHMVSLMFDAIIDYDVNQDGPSQQHVAQTLTVFAKVKPKLFTGEQLSLLEPYVKNLSTSDNLPMYNAVVVIFRYVVPSLSSLEHNFLRDVQSALLASIPKVTRLELPETAACLWILNRVLKNPEKLIRFMISLLDMVSKRSGTAVPEAEQAKMKRYIDIAGPFGKACNFDEHASLFRDKFPSWKGSSVSGLIIDLLHPFTRQNQPQVIRESALESTAMICQAWPQHYLRNDVSTAFELVFHNENSQLQEIVLNGFKLFFLNEESRSEAGADIKVGEGAVHGQERLSTAFIASDNDGAATSIAQKFLRHILQIALATTDDLALSATQVIASINRQGLVHPKECGPALIALETSTNKAIAKIAVQEHSSLHHKHESMFEKEYMKSVTQAFEYQRDVINDVRGITLQPYVPKLRPLFDVLKSGNSKVRKRFLGNICARVDFELSKLDVDGELPAPVIFARFVVENLAFFDYGRIDEILHLVNCLEKIVVAGTGTAVAHAIEIDVLKVKLVPTAEHYQMNGGFVDPRQAFLMPQEEPTNDLVDPTRLRQLTVAVMILTMVWETRTHLRAMWGLQKSGKTAAKLTAKDLNKAPSRTPFMNGEKFVDKVTAVMATLSGGPEAELSLCKSFAELLSIDHELKIAEGDDDEAELARQAAGYETPSGDEGEGNMGSTGKRKRKALAAGLGSGTPSKRPKKTPTPKKMKVAGPQGRRRSGAGSSDSADGDYEEGWD